MKILITGRGGQLAQTFEKILRDIPEIKPTFFSSVDLDITNREAVSSVFAKDNYDFCINCAAYTAVDKAENDRIAAFGVNATGVENLAKNCLEYSITLIHISTDFVFNGQRRVPYSEEDSVDPINVYGLSKLKGEQLIESHLEQYFIIRTSWLYSEFGNNFVRTMVRLGKEKSEIRVVDDQTGSPTYALDLARFIIHIIENNIREYGIYHYSNDGELSWFDFAKKIFEETDLKIKVCPIPTKEYPTPAKRPTYSVLDKSKVKDMHGVQVPYWEDSLKKCLENMNHS